jgi:NTE family protein
MANDVGFSKKRPKIGLALGGGVARGWAHIGVMRTLRRYGIDPDIVCGSSVGALVGGIDLAGKTDVLEDWVRGLTRLKIASYLDLRLRSGGLIGGNRLLAEMHRHIGDVRIEDLPVPFVATATDLVTGHEVWLQNGALVDAMRASFSLPGVFPPVRVDGRWLVDGALVNPVPVDCCRALGAQMVIAVNLSADLLGKARKPGATVPTAAGFDLLRLVDDEIEPEAPPPSGIGALARRVFRRDYDGPSLFGVMVSSLGIITDRITRSRLAGEPPDVHIAPRLGHIGLLEFDRADECIREGMAAVERSLPDLHDALVVFGNGARDQGRGQ